MNKINNIDESKNEGNKITKAKTIYFDENKKNEF